MEERYGWRSTDTSQRKQELDWIERSPMSSLDSHFLAEC